MRLNQFDKLKSTCEALVQNYRQLKFQIIRLEKENKELKSKLELLSEQNTESSMDGFSSLKDENERLINKNQKVRKQLENLVGKLEGQEI
jgi:predicted  nucleic acid-binding Zn-ribbon protein